LEASAAFVTNMTIMQLHASPSYHVISLTAEVVVVPNGDVNAVAQGTAAGSRVKGWMTATISRKLSRILGTKYADFPDDVKDPRRPKDADDDDSSVCG
jgi:hypothetical protein